MPALIPTDLNHEFKMEGWNRLLENGSLQSRLLSEWGSIACLFVTEEVIPNMEPRYVFVPDAGVRASFSHVEYHRVYQTLNQLKPTLCLAQSAMALDRGTLPGERTLFAPRFSSLHRQAIALCHGVASFHLEPILVGIANHVPGVLLCREWNQEAKAARELGIPVVCKNDPRDLAVAAAAFLENYPWNSVTQQCVRIKEQLLGLLKKSGAKLKTLKVAPAVEKADRRQRLTVCSISDTNYLPFLLGFIQNLIATTQNNFELYVLALDEGVSEPLKLQFPASRIECLQLKDLWTESELKVIQTRSVGFRAFSSKARLLAHALKKEKRPVFHFDSDVYFFQNPQGLLKSIAGGSVLLFPHWNDRFPEARIDGLFNAGMIGVAPGAEPFLNWWGDACLNQCSFDHGKGMVGDQGYLDFAPVLFDNVRVYRDRDHDVARWNLKSLGVHWDPKLPESLLLGDGKPIASYHAAFVDEVGVFEKKYAWDQLISFFSGAYVLGSSSALRTNVLSQQRVHWSTLVHVQKLQQWLSRMRIGSGKYNSENIHPFFWLPRGRRILGALLILNRGLRSLRTHRLLRRLKPVVPLRPIPPESSKSPELDDTQWILQNQKAIEGQQRKGSLL